MLSYKIYIYTPIIVLLFRISAIFMEIVESTPQITTTGSLEGGMLKQVKYEDSDHTATDDDYSDGLRSGFDSNPAPVRTLGKFILLTWLIISHRSLIVGLSISRLSVRTSV